MNLYDEEELRAAMDLRIAAVKFIRDMTGGQQPTTAEQIVALAVLAFEAGTHYEPVSYV